jgi:hypothetical protein
MSKSTLVDDASQQQQQKRQLRARRGRSAAAGTSRSGSPGNSPDAAACLELDTNTPLETASMAALDSKQLGTQQQQQEVLDASHQPDIQPTGRAAKRQRQQQHDAQAAAAAAPQKHMSAFEAERAARIAANMARLAALELPQIAAGLAAMQPAGKAKGAAGPSQRGVGSSKRKRSDEPQQPVRRSARNKGEGPDPATAGGIDYETRDGSVVLHGAGSKWCEAVAAVVAAPPGPLPFRSSNGDEASDAAFLALLAAQAGNASEQQQQLSSSRDDSTADGQASRRGNSSGSSSSATGQQLSGLSLAAADVAKMTRDGISCLAFHPSSSRLLIAAADKQGKVRHWGQQQQRCSWLLLCTVVYWPYQCPARSASGLDASPAINGTAALPPGPSDCSSSPAHLKCTGVVCCAVV